VRGLAGIHDGETGMVGRLVVVWLLAVAVAGVAGIDTASILLTEFQLADTASTAASTAANSYRDSRSTTTACQAAATSVAQADADAKLTKRGCVVNTQTGQVTISIRRTAHTVVAGRFGLTKHFTHVTASDTEGPSTL
jgi:uncharacterized membrane protein